MANEFIKAERVLFQGLGLLEREIVLPNLVARFAGDNFRGAKNDTITYRLPAYTTARERVLRGGRPITMDELAETSVNITLDTDVYKAVPITDEELTLDIRDFGEQINQPIISSVARLVEEKLVAEMEGAPYAVAHDIEFDPDNPLATILRARRLLNDANVPLSERSLLVGSAIEEILLNNPTLLSASESGSTGALRDASVGRLRGFNIVHVPVFDPNMAIAFHRTAFALSTVAPVVPDGVTWGASASWAGLAMRVLRDYDFMNVRDRFLADLFMGTNHVADKGTFNDDGKWVPWDGDEDYEPEAAVIRAVRMTYTES